MPWKVTPHVGGVFTSVTTKSDHKTVVLRLVPAVEMGTTKRWRFPEELLKDEESLHSLGEQLASVQGTGEEWWGAAHRVLRDAARSWDRKQAAMPAPVQQIVRECSPSSVVALSSGEGLASAECAVSLFFTSCGGGRTQGGGGSGDGHAQAARCPTHWRGAGQGGVGEAAENSSAALQAAGPAAVARFPGEPREPIVDVGGHRDGIEGFLVGDYGGGGGKSGILGAVF